jgi:hypothetical protein
MTTREEGHWSERGRATPVTKADTLGRPRRSVLPLGGNGNMKPMRLFTKTILLVTSIAPFGFGPGGYAQTNTQSVEAFLPKGTVTETVYVQIERDPALDDYARRIREAREKNPGWYLEYSKQHQKPGFAAVPYHEINCSCPAARAAGHDGGKQRCD